MLLHIKFITLFLHFFYRAWNYYIDACVATRSMFKNFFCNSDGHANVYKSKKHNQIAGKASCDHVGNRQILCMRSINKTSTVLSSRQLNFIFQGAQRNFMLLWRCRFEFANTLRARLCRMVDV